MVTDTAGGRKAKAAETERALKDAAMRVFERIGYLNAKITDITAEAGRAAGSFYNHFSGKEQLLESLIADMFATGDEFAAEHPGDHDLSEREQMRFHVAGFWQTFRQHRPVFVALLQASMVDEGFAARLRELLAPEAQVLRDHLEYVRDRGFTLPGDPVYVAAAMSAMWLQFAYNCQVTGGVEFGGPPGDDEAVDMLTDFSLRGIVGERRS
jgi:AcrR family transcriptional regulator